MTIIACEQRSPEWYAARLGRLTSSRIGDAFATTKSGYSTSRRNLVMQLVLERLTGKPQERDFQSWEMTRGLEMEAEARAMYEAEHGALVETVGCIQHDSLMVACSPDGLPADGLIEVKCPKAAIHLEYLRGGLPLEFHLQIVNTLWVTGRKWGDFVSYNPDFPERLRLKSTRLLAKDIDFKAHELNVRLFLKEVDAQTQEIENDLEDVV